MRFRSLVIDAVAGSFAACTLFAAPSFASDAAPIGYARPVASSNVSLTVHAPLRNTAALDQLISIQGNPRSPMYHYWLTPAQFRAAFGPTPAATNAMIAAFRRHGFALTRAGSQIMHFSGSVASVERAFGSRVHFAPRGIAGRRPVVADGAIRVPADVLATGAKVLSLAESLPPRPLSLLDARTRDNRTSAEGPYWFDDLKQAYSYPTYGAGNGSGVTIGVVGYTDFSQSDAQQYFANEKLGGTRPLAPAPSTEHMFFGPDQNGFDPSSGDGVEADLDIEQSGGSAPGATIVNLADSSYPYFMDAYQYVIDSNSIDIVTTSYGNCELLVTPAYNNGSSDQMNLALTYHSLFQQGNALGITFVASSGDNGGLQCQPQAYFGSSTGTVYPALQGVIQFSNDPNVTAVGGTNLQTSAVSNKLTSTYVSETENANLAENPQDDFGTGNYISPYYFGSGGGVSTIFAEPDYQTNFHLKYSGRAVPDVSMHMGGCPHSIPFQCEGDESGDETVVGGAVRRILGTSASSPEFAGLLAVKESIIKQREGNENYDLYALGADQGSVHYFHNGIPGNDGVWTDVQNGKVHFGYNLIVGLGTPLGNTFVQGPSLPPVAGAPQTTGNP